MDLMGGDTRNRMRGGPRQEGGHMVLSSKVISRIQIRRGRKKFLHKSRGLLRITIKALAIDLKSANPVGPTSACYLLESIP